MSSLPVFELFLFLVFVLVYFRMDMAHGSSFYGRGGGKANKRPRAQTPTSPEPPNLLPSIRELLDGHMSKINDRLSVFENNMKTQANQMERKLEEFATALAFQGQETMEMKHKLKFIQSQTVEKEATILNEIDKIATYVARENLVFMGVPEPNANEDTERVLGEFLVTHLKLSQDQVSHIEYQRVHRVPAKTSPRPIKARFLRFTDKMMIQNQSKQLKGTSMYVSEDLPKRVRDARQAQMKALRAAREAGKLAYFSRNDPAKLFVDKVWVPISHQEKFIQDLQEKGGGSGFSKKFSIRPGKEARESTVQRSVKVSTPRVNVNANQHSGKDTTPGANVNANQHRGNVTTPQMLHATQPNMTERAEEGQANTGVDCEMEVERSNTEKLATKE